MEKRSYYKYRLKFVAVFVVVSLVFGCSRSPQYREVILPPGNEYIDPVDPANDDSDQILTEYSQFPDSVKQKIEQILPAGEVGGIEHWMPFAYIVYKNYADGHSNKIYIRLTRYVRQVLYIEGDYIERPGVFFESGTEKEIGLSDVPEIILTNVKRHSGSDDLLKAWVAESDIGPTYVIEVTGFQGPKPWAFAYRPDGVLKTVSSVDRMREGVPHKWTEQEVEELLGKYRDKYGVDSVLARIQSIPYAPEEGFRFVVLGDNRINKPLWEAVCKSISKKDVVFAIVAGDLVNEGEPEQFDEYLFGVLEKYGRFNLVPVIGNHDTGYDGLAFNYLTSFGPNSLNYYFDYGNARFVIIDNVSRVTSFLDQLEVVDHWLAETPEGFFKFVFMHVPPGNIRKWTYHAMDIAESEKFTELVAKHRVDHVFVGHIHAYSTTNYLGVDYTITGGAGALLHHQYGPKGSVHHYIIVDVTPDGIKQQLVQFKKED